MVELAPDGTTTKYLYAGSQRLAALETKPRALAFTLHPSPSTRFVRWLAHLDKLLAFVFDVPEAEAAGLSDCLRFFHPDHLGSVNLVTDASGKVVESTTHTPYGSVHQHARRPAPTLPATEACVAEPALRPGFTGQRQDSRNGLIHFPARSYDPALGRFLQADPLVPVPGDPQALNRYSYVRNNPINLVDPSGHGWFSKLIGAVVGVGVTILTGGCIPCGMAAFSFTDTLISARQAGVSWGRSLALAGTNAAIAAVASGIGGLPAYAAGGALQGVTSAAILGGDIGQAAWTGAVSGLVTAGAGPIIGGGVGSVLNGGSFGRGAAEGAMNVAAILAIAATSQAIAQGKLNEAQTRSSSKVTENDLANDLIVSDRNVRIEMELAWYESDAFNSFGRHEEGGWIFQHPSDMLLVERWPSGGRASIRPTPAPNSAVAHFHTHPNYGTGGTGIKGPSPHADVPFTRMYGLPGYIVDKESIIRVDPQTGNWGEVEKR